jgi:hypothetical protein
MYAEPILRLMAFAILAAIGYQISRMVPAPRRSLVWIACLAATVMAGYVGVSAKLVAIQGLILYASNSLQGLGFGLISGWLVRAFSGGELYR